MSVYDEIKAVYSRHNKELTLSIFDKDDNLIVSSKMPKLIAYQKGDEVNGPNNQKFIVTDVEDNIFNPKKLHIAKMVKEEIFYSLNR
jgi:hypothetical protein